MRAALAIDQRAVAIGAACFPVVVILLALVVALIDCRPLAEIPRFLLLVGAWSALITFGIWAVGAWRYRTAVAAGTYQRYSGPVEVQADHRRNRII